MNDRLNPPIGRRDVLRALSLGAGATLAATVPLARAEAASDGKTAKGRARYQPNSPDVQNFYRVNRYPAK
jgi:hypothetical protein